VCFFVNQKTPLSLIPSCRNNGSDCQTIERRKKSRQTNSFKQNAQAGQLNGRTGGAIFGPETGTLSADSLPFWRGRTKNKTRTSSFAAEERLPVNSYKSSNAKFGWMILVRID
jgi:hypothetical protein